MKTGKQIILGFVLLMGVLLCGSPVWAVDAPVVTPVAGVCTDQTVRWSWTGSGTANEYRYSLDDPDDWVLTSATSFTPAPPLARGSHTLYVQESDGTGGWSVSGSATLYCLATDLDGTVLLGDAADMSAFSDFVNAVPISTNPANSLTNAKLTADVTLANDASNPWKPIGKDGNYCYRGVFDGDGHVIRGLYINSSSWFTGFFGMSTGTIKNLTIGASTISGSQDVGAIVGMANSGSQIINCHNAASVSGSTRVGGIAGTFLGSLQNCSNSGAVTGYNGDIGGLVGFQQGTILNSFNSGVVKSTQTGYMAYVEIGGISGKLFSGSTSNCYNSGTISVAGSGGSCYSGAIIGERSSGKVVNNCYYLTGSAPKGIGNSSADVATETASKVTAAFTGGEVAYRLQSGQANQVWGQTLAGSADHWPVLTAQPEKKVVRVLLDYSDATADVISYHNENDTINIPQSTDYAVTLDSNPYTAVSYTVGTSDATFLITTLQNITGVTVASYNGYFDGIDHPAVTVTGDPAGTTISYSLTGDPGSYTDTLPMINAVGSVTVYVKISGYYYYDFISDQMGATVAPASPPMVAAVAKDYCYSSSDNDESTDIAALLPANRGSSSYSLGTVTDLAAIVDGTPTIGADGILHYGVKSGAIGQTATIPVLISSHNYTPITVAVQITLTDKAQLTIGGLTVSNKSYDGSPVVPAGTVSVTAAGGGLVDPGPLNYRYTSTDGGGYDSSAAPRNAGAYQLVIAVPADHPAYRGSSDPLSFSITPRPLTITALDQSIKVGADRPADSITAPDLAPGETISGVSFSCDYSKNDAVTGVAGNYPITPAGGTISGGNSNYEISYAPGTLTVSPVSSGGGGGTVTPPITGVVVTANPIRFDSQGHLSVDISGAPTGAVTYYSRDGITYTPTPPTITAAGIHPLFVKISAPGYADFLTRTTVIVEKADPPAVPELIIPYPLQPDGESAAAELAALLPEDRGATGYAIASIDDPEGLLSSPPTLDETGRLLYRLAPRPATSASNGDAVTTTSQTAKSASVMVTVTMANYVDITIPVIIREETAAALFYRTHIENQGWESSAKTAGEVSGTMGQSLRLEAIEISTEAGADLGIRYKTHVQNIGWQDFVADGETAGTFGQSLRLEAIVLELTGTAAADYDLYYQVHAQNIGWLDWAKNGESAGTAGYGYRLEALRIVLLPKGSTAPGATGQAFIEAKK